LCVPDATQPIVDRCRSSASNGMRLPVNRLIPHMLATMATIAVLGLARPGSAQERPAPVAEVHGGTLLFADDSVVKENFIGGAGRFYVLPRISIGPEIAYISGSRHSHLMLTGNLTFDLLGSTSG